MERISLSIFSFFFFMNLESLRICNWIRGPRFFFLLQVSVAFAVFRPSSINPACITVLSKYRVFSVVMISHAIRIVCRVSFFVCSHRRATYDSERMKSVVAVILRIYPQTLNICASCNKIWRFPSSRLEYQFRPIHHRRSVFTVGQLFNRSRSSRFHVLATSST